MHRPGGRTPRQAQQLRRRLYVAIFVFLAFILFYAPSHRTQEADSRLIADESNASDKDGAPTIILTASNWMYRSLLHNFFCTLKRLPSSPQPVVHSLDTQTHVFAATLGLTSSLSHNATSETASQPGKFARSGPLSFDSITKQKLTAVRDALRAGFSVLLSDADIFWCSDPRPVLRRIMKRSDYADADVVVQAEAGYRTLNSGFYFARATGPSVALFDALVQHADVGHHDQDVLNWVFCNEKYGGKTVQGKYGDNGHVPFSCQSRGATIRLLDARLFPSGAQRVATPGNETGVPIFSLSRKELAKRCTDKEFVVLHNNFIRADKKVARLMVKGMWFLDGEEDTARCSVEAVEASAKAVRTCGAFC